MKLRIGILMTLALALCLGGLTVGGIALSPAMAVLAEEVTLVRSAPTGCSITFSQEDFQRALGTCRLNAITLTALPPAEDGTLTCHGEPVQVGQALPADALSSLVFLPGKNMTESRFTFTAGELCGGAVITCLLRTTPRANSAPTVKVAREEDLCLSTQKGVSLFGTLAGADPEGDALVYHIVSYPTHGRLQLTNTATGAYRYEPEEGFRGEDSFRYVVRDEYGGWSEVAEVTVNVCRPAVELVYEDLRESPAGNAALTLTGEEIMHGTLRGDGYYFDPELSVSRGEFTVMAMKAVGVRPIPGLTEACFDDNSTTDPALRPYIAAAQRYGIVYGDFDEDGRLCFHAEEPISRGEAAVILCRLLDAEPGEKAPAFADTEAIPVWAQDAVGALYEMGIFPANGQRADAKDVLNREDAATMLYKTLLCR